MNTPETPSLIEVPAVAPVMVLPDVSLFPGALMPLFIFEERYREMLAWALENERMFCMALLRKGRSEWTSSDDFHHVAGLGLVRASVEREDGTSHVILQGLVRVKFTGFVQTEPFVIAKLRDLPTKYAPPEDADALSAMVRNLCAQLQERGLEIPDELQSQIDVAPDAGTLSDLVAHTLLRDPFHRQSVLESADISTRLRTLIAHLRTQML